MTPTGPDQLWVADLTYLQVGRETGFLAIVLDTWSRRVIGYAAGPILEARLPQAAWRPLSRAAAPGRIHYSDCGTQYASRRSRERLEVAPLMGSMSCAGNPHDYARVERFMKTREHEEVYLQRFRTIGDLLTALPACLEDTYKTTRLQAALGYLPPAEY
jgi:putative transposase